MAGTSPAPSAARTERASTTSPTATAGKLEIETVDITVAEQIAALHSRLAPKAFDLLFVNSGVTNQPEGTVAEASTDEFVRVMVTNALGPLRVIDALEDHTEPAGTIGVMSSGQGSVANNERGGHEVYRGSKAALNTFMRSYAARHHGEQRSLVLMAPGWVQTDMGGPDAWLSIDDSIPNVVKTIDALRQQSGPPLCGLPRPRRCRGDCHARRPGGNEFFRLR